MRASIALSFARSTGVLLLALVAAAPAAANVVSVTLNPPTITGGTGASTIGTVAIGQPAPAGGRVINLASSNTDLAASTERVVVPAGATTATFTVGTNALYRAYSGLAFNVTITATDPADGGAASAVLHVTAQAIPGPFWAARPAPMPGRRRDACAAAPSEQATRRNAGSCTSATFRRRAGSRCAASSRNVRSVARRCRPPAATARTSAGRRRRFLSR